MKKGILLLGISYALLTACGTHVSLTENYFEDENFYNPTLTSPQFALESLKSTDIYSELDYDQFWDTTAQVVTPDNRSRSSRSNWGGYGMSSRSNQYQGNSFGWGQGLGYGVPYMFGNLWQNPWQLGPPNYWNQSMFGGYGYNSWSPYGYNGYGYNNGYGYGNSYGYNNSYGNGYNWGNNSSTWTSNNTPRSGTNYGGRRPSKYSSSRGNSSSNGKTSNSGNSSGWTGIVAPVRQAIEESKNATARTAINESSSAGSISTRPRSNSSGDPQARPTETYHTESKPSRTANTSSQASPSQSSSSSRTSVQSSGGRRR